MSGRKVSPELAEDARSALTCRLPGGSALSWCLALFSPALEGWMPWPRTASQRQVASCSCEDSPTFSTTGSVSQRHDAASATKRDRQPRGTKPWRFSCGFSSWRPVAGGRPFPASPTAHRHPPAGVGASGIHCRERKPLDISRAKPEGSAGPGRTRSLPTVWGKLARGGGAAAAPSV